MSSSSFTGTIIETFGQLVASAFFGREGNALNIWSARSETNATITVYVCRTISK
ncbi:MAG: hypothetical protein M1503_06175 [Thaumarchaeota archaeon]|nr:hypothetical protein [Nitrososphaerota archaeon]MCL5317830.1 hypothetical protein [Nitrososphaerota archaeon]